MSEFQRIATDADTIAAEPQGPVTRNDMKAIVLLIGRLARAIEELPKPKPKPEAKRPVGRPPKAQ